MKILTLARFRLHGIYVHGYMLNKNTWGVKKVRGQEEPVTKSSDIK